MDPNMNYGDMKRLHVPPIPHFSSSIFFLGLHTLLTLGALSPILQESLQWSPDIWSHLSTYVLPSALPNTLWLVAGVSFSTLCVGSLSGWICSQYEFKGRKLISRLLVLPLALPAYILAFVYLGLFDFAGELRLWLLERNWKLAQFYLQGGWGAGFVLTLSLYPYVYLFAYRAFQTQGHRWQEVSQSLGHSRLSSFFRVEWGFCYPWILGAVALVAMEVTADFGAVALFNYDTLSTSIYKVWFDLQSWTGAAQLSSLLMLLLLLLSLHKLKAQGRKKYESLTSPLLTLPHASWAGKMFIYPFLGALIFFSLIIPLFYLIKWAGLSKIHNIQTLSYAQNSLTLGLIGASFMALWTFWLCYQLRLQNNSFGRWCQKVFQLGYTLPGTVLAVGLIGFATQWNSMISIGMSVVILLFGYMIRFQAIGIAHLQPAFQRISTHIDESTRILTPSLWRLLTSIHFPILKKSIWISGLFIFIEIIKEMPLTLMLRPLGWDTLAIKIFEFTSEGDWERAALPALIIVLLGLLASWWMEKETGKLA